MKKPNQKQELLIMIGSWVVFFLFAAVLRHYMTLKPHARVQGAQVVRVDFIIPEGVYKGEIANGVCFAEEVK